MGTFGALGNEIMGGRTKMVFSLLSKNIQGGWSVPLIFRPWGMFRPHRNPYALLQQHLKHRKKFNRTSGVAPSRQVVILMLGQKNPKCGDISGV